MDIYHVNNDLTAIVFTLKERMKSNTVLTFRLELCSILSRRVIVILDRVKQASPVMPNLTPEQKMLLHTAFIDLTLGLLKTKTLHFMNSTLRDETMLHCERGLLQECSVLRLASPLLTASTV